MKNSFFLILILFISSYCFSQNKPNDKKPSNKGKFYLSWGWNREWYTKSDIYFKGDNYDFTLKNTVAKDRQTPFTLKNYFDFYLVTVPQTNYRIGYFINDKYNVSLGFDHMKYVVQRNQTVKISGEIKGTGSGYDKIYNNDDIVIQPGFLKFEHTDGLNYIHGEIRRFDKIIALKNLSLNIVEGLALGILRPKTDATLLNYKRNDHYHIAGYGINATIGLNLSIYKHFFIQSELKGGYINMPKIRPTSNPSDYASQHFFFNQFNVIFGYGFWLDKKYR